MVGRCKTLLRRHQHQAARPNSPRRHTMTRYQHAIVDGSKIFYREAGPKTAPTILLLHGFPTSSHMFRNLIPTLADRYHVIEMRLRNMCDDVGKPCNKRMVGAVFGPA